MRTLKFFLICLALTLSACSRFGSEDEGTVAPADPTTSTTSTDVAETTVSTVGSPAALAPEEAAETCPSIESLSSVADLPLTGLEATASELDFVGSDPEAGVTHCAYEATESATSLTVSLHGSPINMALFLDAPPPGADVTELPSGAVQIQFEGQAGCEIYDDQVSVILITESDSADSCAVVAAAREAVQ